MSNLITISTWLNNNNYILILIVPISFILCYNIKRYLADYYNNNLLISNTRNTNLSIKLVSKKSDQLKDPTSIESIEDIDQEPPSYNEII